jgi:hypothetical protein
MTTIFRLASVAGLKVLMDTVTGTSHSVEIISIH